MATVGERAVTPEPSAADALEEPTEEIDVTAALGATASCLAPTDVLDTSPQPVGDRRVGPPRCLTPRAAFPGDPAVVGRVHQHAPQARRVQSGLLGERGAADSAQRVPLEDRDSRPDRDRVDFEDVATLGRAPEPERGVPARVAALLVLRRVPVRDPVRKATTVLLGYRRLADQLGPCPAVGRQDVAIPSRSVGASNETSDARRDDWAGGRGGQTGGRGDRSRASHALVPQLWVCSVLSCERDARPIRPHKPERSERDWHPQSIRPIESHRRETDPYRRTAGK